MQKNLRIVFMGTPEYSVPTLHKLCEAGLKPVLVLTRPDAPAGRGNHILASPVKLAAQELDIPVYQPTSLRTPAAYDVLQKYAPDLAVVIAYGMILPQAMLDLPAYGCINLHASLLPEYRGAAPIQRAIMDGQKLTGVSLMQMSASLDEGPVYAKRKVQISEEIDSGELHDILAELSAEILLENLSAIVSGALEAIAQDHANTSYAAKITKADELIMWNQTTEKTINRIRALSPFPGSFTYLNQKRVKIWKARRFVANDQQKDLMTAEKPGTLSFNAGNSLCVYTADGLIEILELQLEGKKRMPADQFLKGLKKDTELCFNSEV